MNKLCTLAIIDCKRHCITHKYTINGRVEQYDEEHMKAFDLRFQGQDKTVWLDRFKEWVSSKGGAFYFDNKTLMNTKLVDGETIDAVKPEGYSCWCQVATDFLIESDFGEGQATDTTHIFKLCRRCEGDECIK